MRGAERLAKRVERAVEAAALPLVILKLLSRGPSCGSELRRAVYRAGFSLPHQTTFYACLGLLRLAGLVESDDAGRGRRKEYRITPEGEWALARAEAHLRGLLDRLASM